MKLLYIANIRLPTEKAHGVQIMKTCEALAAAGAQVELVVTNRRTEINEDPFDYYGVLRTFTLKRLAVWDTIGWGRWGFLFESLQFVVRAVPHVASSGADVLYGRDEMALWLMSFVDRRPMVWESHTGAWNFFARRTAHRVRTVVTISQGLKDFYVARGIPAERIVVVHDGVDLGVFAQAEGQAAARARLGLPQDKKVALYVGRLDGWKGTQTFFEAAALLPLDVCVAVIGGEAAQVAALRAVHPRVLFLGYRPYRELPGNQAAADVLVLPNSATSKISARFTSPLKLFTYMASGRPIVASDIPSVREVLSDRNAVLVEPDNPKKLADGIAKILQDHQLANRLAAQALVDVKAYTWQARARTILDCISKGHKTFLVIQGAKLGDMVCTTPLFRAIKNNFPGAHLYVAGDKINKEVLEGNTHVDGYLYLKDLKAEDIRAKKIDVALLLNPNPSVLLALIKAGVKKIIVPKVVGGFSPYMTKKYRLLSLWATVVPHRMGHYAPGEYLRMLGALGVHADDTTKELFYSDEARTKVDTFLRAHQLTAKKFAVVSPSAGNKIKNWPAERFARVAEALAARGMPVVVIGGPRDAEEVADMINSVKHPKDIIDASGEFSIDELKAFIARAGLFVSVDTGPIYIAEAFNVPTIDIIGPMDEREQPPRGPKHLVVVPERTAPQLHIMNARMYDEAEARRQVDSISVEQTLEAVDQILFSKK